MHVDLKLSGNAHVVCVDGVPVAVLTRAREARRLRQALAGNLPGAEVTHGAVAYDRMPLARYPALPAWLSGLPAAGT